MSKLDNLKHIVDANLNKLDMSEENKLRLKKEVMKHKKISLKKLSFIGIPSLAAVLAVIVLFTGVFSNATSRVYAKDLMKDISPKEVKASPLSEDFINSTADFSIELFKNSYTKGKNSLISPTSVYLALGMTANGAEGNTLKDFETLLGKYNIKLPALNTYYNSLIKALNTSPEEKVSIANSIWFSNDRNLKIKKTFLQTNADYYGASAYEADFSDKQTVTDINNWVKNNTNNLIDSIIDKIDTNTIMYLINTIYFEDKWKEIYTKESVNKGAFKLEDGKEKMVEFMNSTERGYLKDDKVQGFIKPYRNGKYSFVALLPNEGISLDSYISSLTGEQFIKLLKNRTNDNVAAGLPKFKAEYSASLEEPLKKMGLKDCFSEKANLSNLAEVNIGDIYISNILHKTSIIVDTKGTKAAAVTRIAIDQSIDIIRTPPIILNRPFIYAIVDNTTNLPLFIGTMTNPEI